MTSRRSFLRNMTGASLAAGSLAAFPPSIRKALAIPANNKTGTIKDVEHIVVLMQENRSFDHYFGTLKGVRGFGDRFTIPLPNGRNVWQQNVSSTESVLPYHLDSTKGNAQRVNGTPHSWSDGQAAWDHGRMNFWPKHKNRHSMGYYREAEVPFQFAMANAFTLCDAYHCSMHTGTNSNRMFLWTGTNGPSGSGECTVNNAWDSLGSSLLGYEWKTYPERLEEAGISWKVYQNLPDNFTDNSLAGFKQYRRANEQSGKPNNSPYDPADNDGNPLYKGVANTMPDGGFFGQLRKDVEEGNLPQISWVVAPANYSEHPGPSSPVQGAWYTQELLDALTANPEVWSKTVLLVNFDENDGFFDHVPSPSAPSIDPVTGKPAGKTSLSEEEIAFEYYNYPSPKGLLGQPPRDGKVFGPGVRVPMYVISPWSRGGWVNSQVFDHTSVIRFMEERFGVMEPNISPYRRAVCGDLTSAFNFASPNDEPLPTLNGRRSRQDADSIRSAQERLAQVPQPVDNQRIPVQQTGVRPSRALPYELHVSARCDSEKGVQLLFSNTGKAAAVFHVYDKLNLDRIPRRYMVNPDQILDDVWDVQANNLGHYDLWVLGPNGFHRHFRGDVSVLSQPEAARPEIRVCYEVTKGDIYLEMMNGGQSACAFTIQSMAYREDGPWEVTVEPGQQSKQSWALKASGHWYDFVVRSSSDPSYYRRFAGRVEFGEHGVSDPALGIPAYL
ncbi:phosphocholine-specific phospholipase C [Alcaligenes faecalis]|uniref:phosphocholine-specific phospholipase C n=1 Tax=Alcaligenes faecalis TaxID=511 RepID=UPI0034D64335